MLASNALINCVQSLKAQTLELSVFDDDGLSKNDFIGQLHLPLCDVLREPLAGWYELQPQHGREAVKYTPSAADGPSRRVLAQAHVSPGMSASELFAGKGDLVALVRVGGVAFFVVYV